MTKIDRIMEQDGVDSGVFLARGGRPKVGSTPPQPGVGGSGTANVHTKPPIDVAVYAEIRSDSRGSRAGG